MTLPTAGIETEAKTAAPARPFEIDVSHLITEDDAPVESVYQEQQMRLLTESLNSSWKPGRKFVCMSDVGLFYRNDNPAIVPDVMLIMDVDRHPDRTTKAGKSYLMWENGKPPEIVIEIVSNTEGEELTRKRQIYAERVRAPYYVVWDPFEYLRSDRLTVFRPHEADYLPSASTTFPTVGLGLTVWNGVYEGMREDWLRWTDLDGNLILTGSERANAAEEQVDFAKKHVDAVVRRADAAEARAEAEKRRADAALAKLRELGIDPASVGL